MTKERHGTKEAKHRPRGLISVAASPQVWSGLPAMTPWLAPSAMPAVNPRQECRPNRRSRPQRQAPTAAWRPRATCLVSKTVEYRIGIRRSATLNFRRTRVKKAWRRIGARMAHKPETYAPITRNPIEKPL